MIRIEQDELDWVTEEMKEYMTGPAGTVFLLDCRTIHGSTENHSDRSRPVLLNVYSAADAFPYAVNPIPSPCSKMLKIKGWVINTVFQIQENLRLFKNKRGGFNARN